MATIPRGEGLGQVIARPYNAPGRVAGASGEGVAQAIGQASGMVLDRMERTAAVEAQQLEQQQRQAQRFAQQAADEAYNQRQAANKAQANALMMQAQDDLAVLHDEFGDGVKTGQIDKTKAAEEWQAKSRERINAVIETIPQDFRQLAGQQLNHRATLLGRGVQKAVGQRDQSDTLAGIRQTLEYTQRLYGKDPAAADALTAQTLEQLGPFAGLNAEQIRAAGQQWKESTRFATATELITNARRDNKALDAVAQQLATDRFADIDPQRKQQLLHQVEGYRVANEQRAAAQAVRAEAQAAAQFRKAEAEFTAANQLVQGGKMLSDAYIASLTQATAGTPFAKAIPELLKQATPNTAFASQPMAAMDQSINALRAQLNLTGTDPKTEQEVKRLETLRDQARKDYREDPLPAALNRGILTEIAPLDVSSIAAVRRGLGDRIQQAATVATRTGEAVSPLLREEADKVAKLVNALPVDQRSTAIAEIAQAAGPVIAGAIGRQIAPRDKAAGLAFAMAGSKTTQGRYTSELILKGAQAMRDKSIKEDNAAVTGFRAQVAGLIGDAYLNPEARDAAIDAALLTNYGMMAEGSGDIERAVRLATGGIVERAGRKIPLPYGMTESEFTQRMQNITAKDIPTTDGKVYIGGNAVPVATLVENFRAVPLLNAGNGRYAIQTGGGVVTDKTGRPVILEVK